MLWHCRSCSTAYAVGLTCCPHCGSTDYLEDAVPKSHAIGGPSYDGYVDTSPEDVSEPEWVPADEAPAPADEAVEVAPEETAADDKADDKSSSSGDGNGGAKSSPSRRRKP